MPNPILLLHGIPVTSSIWRQIIGPLQAHGPVLAPDLLGFGDNLSPNLAYGPEEYRRWLDEVVLAEVKEPITLIVHDFGGLVGIDFAVHQPERIARLVICNTTVYPDSTWLTRLTRMPMAVHLLNRLLNGPLFAWQMRGLFRTRSQSLIDEYGPIYARPEQQRTIDRVMRSWTPAALQAIAGRLPALTCPVLLLWGMEDRYVFPWQPHGERFQQDLPQARVAKVAEAGHFLQADQPDLVLAHLQAFLHETTAPPSGQ